MSEVNIYYAVPHSMSACAGPGRSAVVFQNEHRRELDRVTAERDAALAELGELKSLVDDPAGSFNKYMQCLSSHRELQQRLTAAEQDARRYRQLRNESVADSEVYVWDERGVRYQECGNYIRGDALDAVVDAALKPAEGGGDEHSS